MPLLMMWWWLWGAFNIPGHIFVPLLFCIFFGWPYVNASDAANKYLYLKYTMWFLQTWTACDKRLWLSLFYDFLLCHCEWGIHICQTWKYLHAIAILQFSPHRSVAMLLATKYLLLNYTMWEYAVMIITVCVLWSFYSGAFPYVFMDIAFYTSVVVGVSSGWPR